MINDQVGKRFWLGAWVLAVGLTLPCHAQTSDAIFDWGVRLFGTVTEPGIAPIPHPGHDWAANNIHNYNSYDWSNANNTTQGIMLHDDSGPVHGVDAPPNYRSRSVIQTLDYFTLKGYTLDYVFSDFEPSSALSYTRAMIEEDIVEVINLVRNHPDPNINQAGIGQYDYAPGDIYDTFPFNNSSAHSFHQFYLDHPGLNVAQPVAYPYAYYIYHANANHFSGIISPNTRSALFWPPLERVSLAKAGLPQGDQLIPWIGGFVPWTGYESAPEPTTEDRAASLRHYRLRGADGYYTLFSGITGLTNQQYRRDMLAVWHGMDQHFSRPGPGRILNLATNKATGVEWSGHQQGNRVLVQATNLGNTDTVIDWSAVQELPAESPTLVAGTHQQLQYRTDYAQITDADAYQAGLTLNMQGWNGPNPAQWEAATPLGTGNPSAKAFEPIAGSYTEYAWWQTGNPGFTATDKVTYSAMVFGLHGMGFGPVNTQGLNSANDVPWQQQGPYVSIYASGHLHLRKIAINGDTYEATNFLAQANHWYEVKLEVDPSMDIDGNTADGKYGAGSLFVRDVTAGETQFTRMVFDNSSTPTVVERVVRVPLALTTNNNVSHFDGWRVYGYTAGHQIDNLNMGYAASQQGDNMLHYEQSLTLDQQGWNGPDPMRWEVKAPSGTGNNAAQVATPVSGSYTEYAWWETDNPGFEADDVVVYSAKIYGAAGMGFAPVYTGNTASANWIDGANQGPYAMVYWNTLRLRQRISNGTSYQATNVTINANAWYEIQVTVDPTQDIDGNLNDGSYGAASMAIRNLTAGEVAFTAVVFDDLSTAGTVESLTQVPLTLTVDRNPTIFNGWWIYGYNNGQQISDIRATLSPSWN